MLEAEPETRKTHESSETREWRALEARANVGELVDNVLSHSAIDGPMREIQQALGLKSNDIPLHLLETRAVSPAPANVGQNQAAIIPYVFPDSVAAFLGVDMPSVGVGESVFPVLTSELDSGRAGGERSAGGDDWGLQCERLESGQTTGQLLLQP